MSCSAGAHADPLEQSSIPAAHPPARHMENQVIELLGEGRRERVTHSIPFKKREKRRGRGGDRGRAIEVAKEIHKSESKSLRLILAERAGSGEVAVS